MEDEELLDNEEVLVETQDPFKMDFEEFDAFEEDTPPASEKKKSVVEKKPETAVESTEQKEEESEEDEDFIKSEAEEIPEDVQLAAFKGVVRLIAEKKGVAEQIDFDSVESTEDLEEILDSFDTLDETIAVERLKQTDKTISQIVEYVEKGGKPEDIVGFLTQSKELAEADISTESGSKQLLKDYYTNVMKFSTEVVNRKIKKLEDSEGLLEEAEDIMPLYQDHLNEQVATKTKKLEEEQKKQTILLQQKKAGFVEALKANKYNKATATNFYSTAFEDVVLSSGEKMPLIDAKILQMKATPEGLLKLASFITDTKFYDEQVLANRGSEIVTQQTKNRLVINNNKGAAPSTVKKKEGGFRLKF